MFQTPIHCGPCGGPLLWSPIVGGPHGAALCGLEMRSAEEPCLCGEDGLTEQRGLGLGGENRVPGAELWPLLPFSPLRAGSSTHDPDSFQGSLAPTLEF